LGGALGNRGVRHNDILDRQIKANLEEAGGTRGHGFLCGSEPEASDVVVVLVPSLLAREAGGQGRFELEAATVREALLQLPVRDLLFDDRSQLRPLVNVYVNRTQVDGVENAVEPDDEIRLVAAVAGG
jgi:molybdopterin converting factor small subunit